MPETEAVVLTQHAWEVMEGMSLVRETDPPTAFQGSE